jgi:hypothetical protein
MARRKPKFTLAKKKRSIPSNVQITRGWHTDGDEGFNACVRVGSKAPLWRAGAGGSNRGVACATGKNPRVALARALKKLAAKIAARKGAFAGVR